MIEMFFFFFFFFFFFSFFFFFFASCSKFSWNCIKNLDPLLYLTSIIGCLKTYPFEVVRSTNASLCKFSAPRDLHRRAAYSVCESWFLIHQDVYHDLFVLDDSFTS